MADLTPQNANEFIEQQLDLRAKALEKEFESDALAFMGRLVFGVDDVIRDAVERKKAEHPDGKKLTVFLTTPGGYIEVVKRIVEMFRHHYDVVDFVIPNYALSAGTVLAMSGDSIHMDYYSRLGPIDPQVEMDNGRMVPALGYLIQYERLLAKANAGKLTGAEIQLMVNGFDQAELYQYEQARDLSIALLEEWLVRYKFKNWSETETHKRPVTEAMKRRRASGIGKKLNMTQKWHSHGHGISMEILRRDLNLRIDDFGENPQRSGCVRGYHNLLNDYSEKRANRGVLHTAGHYVPFA